MKTFKTLILEIFDSSLPLTRYPEIEQRYKATYYPHTLTNIEVYRTTHKNTPYLFVRFKHKGAWEVHFGRLDTDDPNEPLNLPIPAHMNALVGTSLSLYKEKLNRSQPIRYYTKNKDLHSLYDKIFSHLSKTNEELYGRERKDFQGPDGTVFPKAKEVCSRQLDGVPFGIIESSWKSIT